MKRISVIIGSIVGIISVGIVLVIGYGFAVGPTLDKESAALDSEAKAWVDNVIPTIVSNWNSEALLNSGSSEFAGTISKTAVDEMMAQFRNDLGSLTHYVGSTGKVTISIRNFQKSVVATYEAQADFEKGPADIVINAIKEENQWKIYNFHVNARN